MEAWTRIVKASCQVAVSANIWWATSGQYKHANVQCPSNRQAVSTKQRQAVSAELRCAVSAKISWSTAHARWKLAKSISHLMLLIWIVQVYPNSPWSIFWWFYSPQVEIWTLGDLPVGATSCISVNPLEWQQIFEFVWYMQESMSNIDIYILRTPGRDTNVAHS